MRFDRAAHAQIHGRQPPVHFTIKRSCRVMSSRYHGHGNIRRGSDLVLKSFSFPAAQMDLNSIRRVSSAGYRFPERRTCSRKPAEPNRNAVAEPVSTGPEPQSADPVKQDQMWRETVRTERRKVLEWWAALVLTYVTSRIRSSLQFRGTFSWVFSTSRLYYYI